MAASINSINSSFYPRIEPIAINRTERIAANNRQIADLEDQIATYQEVSSITREMIDNNTDQINITKTLIGNNEKQIANNNDTISTIKELISNNEKIIGNNKESIKFLQETQVLAKEAIDCIEKMLAIMMKNPAKYGGLDNSQFQQLPEIMETKKSLTEVVAVKLNEYPKEEHAGLMDTARKVIDRSFDEINTYDLSFDKKIFSNLEKNIDTALAEQYTLTKDDYISTIRNYRIIQKLFHNFSSLSIKNFKT